MKKDQNKPLSKDVVKAGFKAMQEVDWVNDPMALFARGIKFAEEQNQTASTIIKNHLEKYGSK